MSVLAKIVADVENFFKDTSTSAGKFAAAFVKLFKKAPTALQTVNNFIAQVAGLVTAAVALIDPAVSPAVADVFATMETALAAIQAAAASAVSGQSLLQALQNFQTEVPQLLSGLDIKNSALQALITKIVNIVVGECKVLIPAVESWVKQLEAQNPAQPTVTTTAG